MPKWNPTIKATIKEIAFLKHDRPQIDSNKDNDISFKLCGGMSIMKTI